MVLTSRSSLCSTFRMVAILAHSISIVLFGLMSTLRDIFPMFLNIFGFGLGSVKNGRLFNFLKLKLRIFSKFLVLQCKRVIQLFVLKVEGVISRKALTFVFINLVVKFILIFCGVTDRDEEMIEGVVSPAVVVIFLFHFREASASLTERVIQVLLSVLSIG